jgi:hypothetical protein
LLTTARLSNLGFYSAPFHQAAFKASRDALAEHIRSFWSGACEIEDRRRVADGLPTIWGEKVESFWDEIQRCLADSARELDRLIHQMQLLVEGSGESFEVFSYGLQRAKAKVERLNQLGRIYSPPISVPSNAEKNSNHASLVNEGKFWTILWDREKLRIKSSRGIRLLAVLTDNPGRQFHVMDLERCERKDGPSECDSKFASSDGGPMLDDGAKNAYRARLLELRDDLEEAQQFNDLFRASKIKEEMATITNDLARAFGLYATSLRALSDPERVRVRVTVAVKGAIEKISNYNSAVGWHLATSIRTGAFCVYRPAPIARNADRFQ